MRITRTCSFELCGSGRDGNVLSLILCSRVSVSCVVVTVRYSVCVEFFTNRLLPSRVGKSATLRTCSFTRNFPRLLVELFSPYLLVRGVVEPCSAKSSSIVGSSRLWPCLAFLYIVQAAACWILSQDKLTDIVDVNNAVSLRA